MRRFHIASQLALSLWVGALLCFMLLVAPSLFRAYAPDEAAKAVRIILPKLDLLTVAVTVLALGFAFPHRQSRARNIVVAVALVIALVSLFWLTPTMAELRSSANDAISQLPRDHPTRRQFGMLHGVSSTFMLCQVLLGLAAVLLGERRAKPDAQTEPRRSV